MIFKNFENIKIHEMFIVDFTYSFIAYYVKRKQPYKTNIAQIATLVTNSLIRDHDSRHLSISNTFYRR